MAEFEDRTERATPRRRSQAREKGQNPRSRELTAMAATGGILGVLFLSGGLIMEHLTVVTRRLLKLEYGTDPFTVFRNASVDGMMILMPMLLVSMVLAILATAAQGGIVTKKLVFDAGGLNPLNGLKRLLSINGILELLKSLLKFIIGGIVFYFIVKKAVVLLPYLPTLELRQIQEVTMQILTSALVTIFATFFIISLVDYIYQRWNFERTIRMTKEEIRQETKESEGDPTIKARIRSIQRDLARKRMMQQVPKATVVITNPTHIAVALRYERGGGSAPQVIAKGAEFLAERIRETARQHGIPIVEDRPLARALYKVKLDAFIPEELYRAVAKILAQIFRLKGVA